MKSGPGPLPILSGNLCKLKISRVVYGGEGSSLGVLKEADPSFKGTPLGDWSPGSRVQGCLRVRDSDGEPQERVYHLQSASTSFTPCSSPNPHCAGEWARGTAQTNLSKIEQLVLVEPHNLTSQTRVTGAMRSTCWATPFSSSLTASSYTWNLGSIWVLLSYPEASLGVLFPE